MWRRMQTEFEYQEMESRFEMDLQEEARDEQKVLKKYKKAQKKMRKRKEQVLAWQQAGKRRIRTQNAGEVAS